MSAVQLSFSLRLSAGVKTVHLLGSWDNYVGQLPLSKDKTASKSGSWKGTFRFQGSTLRPGKRYWYYYIIDGYHVAHNPSEPSTVEPTTARTLNVLDVPGDKERSSKKDKESSTRKSSSRKESSSKDKHTSSKEKHSSKHPEREREKHRSSKHYANLALDIPKGRPLSVSQIQAPKPMSPHATKHILDVDLLDEDAMEELTQRLGSADIDDDIVTEFSSSPVSSVGSSLSYRSDASSPTSSLSGYSTPNSDCSHCTCERYGITRKGDRVKIDCGGSRCGSSSDSDSACSSGEEEDEIPTSARRHGIVVR